MDEVLVISPKLKKLIDQVPVELLRAPAERYAPLDENKRGSWKYIMQANNPIAVAWTDWETGFDIITVQSGDWATRLGNYPITAKALDIPAGWAYTTLDTFVKSFDEEDLINLSSQQDGKLIGARLDASGDLPEGELETDADTGDDEE